ncbi:CMD domain-containing protein [Pantoea coffeiphila]|uniref:CMD domain-containing protein n=1 Tax=Pantoea coffeiphila TaxID=1465635 RepID=UPI0019617FB6|nr:oxidoreductase [Pantoea coffeiphila]MBM7341190.1 putative peroxidase-related enzyme [Pantoea coffeiphila]
MEQRRFPGNSHWYHETQTSLPAQRSALVPEAADITDRFLLGLTQQAEGELKTIVQRAQPLHLASRDLYQLLFPSQLSTSLTHTLTLYDRISTALTVAQVTGIQRLCNHYAARLNPLPGPDSSRESNRRLTQITEYARQLAGQPTLIDSAALQRLDEVGLTAPDIITFSQIIGFVSYQARVVAGIHALMALPVRWMPGVSVPPDAASLSSGAWQPALTPLEPRYAAADQLEALTFCLPLIKPESFVWLLAQDGDVLNGWGHLLSALEKQHASDDAALAAAVTARINGSSICFAHYPAGELRDALWENVDQALSIATERQKAIILLAAQLTRVPERFSAAHLQPLREAGLSTAEIFDVILSVAAASWSNRLMQSLGTVSVENH